MSLFIFPILGIIILSGLNFKNVGSMRLTALNDSAHVQELYRELKNEGTFDLALNNYGTLKSVY